MQYYGTRLSGNISRREPEGYLLCLNVPVARTGTQEYLPEELGLPPGPSPVPVLRPEEEVFAPETLASFEGMPVTNDHPPDGVDIDNIRRLQMGHAHNVRRGSGEESDLLLADLIITDTRLIDAILAGKREISCGYTYELHEENGQYIQRKIRGNHIAVVDAGRAGPRVSIKDHKKPERSETTMKKSLTKLLARMAKDGDVETVAEFIGEMIGEPETPAETVAEAATEAVEAVEEAVEAAAEAPAVPVAAAVPLADEDGIAGILQRLDRLIELLTPVPAADEPTGETPSEETDGEIPAGEAAEIAEIVEEAAEAAAESATPDAGEIAEIVEAILAPEVSVTLEDPETGGDCDAQEQARDAALRTALGAAAPALARLDPEARRKACVDIARRVRAWRTKDANRGYDALQSRAKDPDATYSTLGKRIMASRNPNFRK